MIGRVRTVRNPLTIIAVFAGLAEVGGTCVLPVLNGSLQNLFIWFLMLFPTFLVTLFFLTLNLNPTVLYAPSDFRIEANYMRLFETGTSEEKALKMEEEIEEAVPVPPRTERAQHETESMIRGFRPAYRDRTSRHRTKCFLAEQLVLNQLQIEFRVPVERNLVLPVAGNRLLFDGAFVKDGTLHIVEVKYYSGDILDPRTVRNGNRTLDRLRTARKLKGLPFVVILAIVTDIREEAFPNAVKGIQEVMADIGFPISIRLYNIESLEETL